MKASLKQAHVHLTKSNKTYAKWHGHPYHEAFHYLLLLLMVWALALYFVFPMYLEASSAVSVIGQGNPQDDMDKLNKETLTALSHYEASSSSEKSRALNGLSLAVERRKAAMLKKMKQAPLQALLYALPSDVLARFPQEVRSSLETEKHIQGKLNVYHIDYPNTKGKGFGRAEFVYELISDKNERFELHFAGKEPKPLSGATVAVTGIGLVDQLAVPSATTGDGMTVLTEASIVPASTNKLLILAFNFMNNSTSFPIATSTLANQAFSDSRSLNAYYSENSFGKVSVSGDVYGWFTIPLSTTGTCDYTSWATAAKNAATSAGYVLSNYTNIMYVFSGTNTGCTWAGLGQVGAGQTWIVSTYATPMYAEGAMYHEFGHNLGFLHAKAMDCGAAQIDVAANCSIVEYGDPSDDMGDWAFADALNHYVALLSNAIHKYQKQWGVSSAQMPTVTASGTYTLSSIEVNDGTPKILQIPKSTVAGPGSTSYYYVSYRKPVGFDAYLPGSFTVGASIYAANMNTSPQIPYLVDTTPSTVEDYTDAPLADGRTFTDPVSGISITQKSHTADTVTVSVTFGGVACAKAAPALSVVPSVFRTSTATPYTYKLTVSNKDANCGPATFDVASLLPTGWASSANPSRLTLAAQTSTTTSIAVTPPANLMNGTTTLQFSAQDIADASHAASVPAYYSFYSVTSSTTTSTSTSDTTAPAVSITSPPNGVSVSGSVSVGVNASDNSGSVSKVELYKDGQLFGSLSSAPYTFAWDSKSDTDGNHAFIAKAYDPSGNTATSSAVTVRSQNTVTVDTTPPAVSITSPQDGAALAKNGNVKIASSASDNVGVTKMEIYLDTALLATCANVTTCSSNYSLKQLRSGSHTVVVKAYDAASNVGQKSITLTN